MGTESILDYIYFSLSIISAFAFCLSFYIYCKILPNFKYAASLGFTAYLVQWAAYILSEKCTGHSLVFNLFIIITGTEIGSKIRNFIGNTSISTSIINAFVEEISRCILFFICTMVTELNFKIVFVFGFSYGLCEAFSKIIDGTLIFPDMFDQISLSRIASNINSITELLQISLIILTIFSVSFGHIFLTYLLYLSKRFFGFLIFGMIAAIILHSLTNSSQIYGEIGSILRIASYAVIGVFVLWRSCIPKRRTPDAREL
jgi:hypothetical protein